MKLDLTPVRSGYVTPDFGADNLPMDANLQRRLQRPMMIGGGVIAVFILGLGLWASVTPLASGITAPGEVRVESNLKTLRHREPGTIKQILVREGQRVKKGDVMFETLPTLYQAEYEAALAERNFAQMELKYSEKIGRAHV